MFKINFDLLYRLVARIWKKFERGAIFMIAALNITLVFILIATHLPSFGIIILLILMAYLLGEFVPY